MGQSQVVLDVFAAFHVWFTVPQTGVLHFCGPPTDSSVFGSFTRFEGSSRIPFTISECHCTANRKAIQALHSTSSKNKVHRLGTQWPPVFNKPPPPSPNAFATFHQKMYSWLAVNQSQSTDLHSTL